MRRIRYEILVLLAFMSLCVLSNVTETAWANVPEVIKIENISQTSTGRIKLQIAHLNPSSNHYVDDIEVDVAGQIWEFHQSPQNSDPFTVELEVGQLKENSNLKARAHCIVHGWGTWSDQIQIPEFVEVGPAIVGALTASLIIAKKSKRRKQH